MNLGRELAILKERLLRKGVSTSIRQQEVQTIETFLDMLPESQCVVATEQFRSIDLLYRRAEGRHVIFGWITESRRPNSTLFANTSLDLLAGYVFLVSGRERVRADIMFQWGAIVAVQYDLRPPERPEAITKGRLVHPLDIPEIPVFRESFDECPLLNAISQRHEIGNVRQPAPHEVREAFLARFDPPMPPDYAKLLSETDGFDVTNASFDGTRSRVIVWPHENLPMISECSDSSLDLCFRERDEVRNIYIMNQLEYSLEQTNSDFMTALMNFFERARTWEHD